LVSVGNYVYVAGGGRSFQILNVTSPANPQWAGTYQYGSGFTRAVAMKNNYAFVANDTQGVLVLDVFNPAAPTFIGTYDTAGSAYDIVVSGNYAYVADWSAELVILDITTPAIKLASPISLSNANLSPKMERAVRCIKWPA